MVEKYIPWSNHHYIPGIHSNQSLVKTQQLSHTNRSRDKTQSSSCCPLTARNCLQISNCSKSRDDRPALHWSFKTMKIIELTNLPSTFQADHCYMLHTILLLIKNSRNVKFTYFHIIDNRQYNYLNKSTNYLMILVNPMLSQRIGKTLVSVMSAV